MTHAQLAKLTPRQLYDHYLHPRDEHGAIAPPETGESSDLTDEQADRIALAMAQSMGTPADVERVKETIRKREEAKRGRK